MFGSSGSLDSRASKRSAHTHASVFGSGHLSPRTPLGMGGPSAHYIAPVPGYTTEYEAKFRWPPLKFYDVDPDSHSGSHRSTPTKEEESPWLRLKAAAAQLKVVNDGNGKSLMLPNEAIIENRLLNEEIEAAYESVKEELISDGGAMYGKEPAPVGSESFLGKGKRRRNSPGTEEDKKKLARIRREALYEFVKAIDNIKK